MFPWHVRGIDELQRRFRHWNRNEQGILVRAFAEQGFTTLDWTSLFSNIPQFDTPDIRSGPQPVGCYEIWVEKIDRQFDINATKCAIEIDLRTYEHSWATEMPENGGYTQSGKYYMTRAVLKQCLRFRLT